MSEFINGRYDLHEKLGIGGMGAVYRATDRLNDSIVALKRVTSPSNSSETSAELQLALASEFKALASLRHPNIIPVLDYGFDDGLPYFTMQYIPDAKTITEVGKEAPYQQKISLLIEMLQALAYLHRRGIIHRDLKPQNALVDRHGNLMLLDFGLAEKNPEPAGDNGKIAGTLAYMAPEVLQGAAPTESSDLYAVGIIAYEIFSGLYPYNDDDVSVLITDIVQTMPDLNELDITVEFAAVINQLLSKTPVIRYQQATQVMEDLASLKLMNLSDQDRNNWNSYLHAANFVGRKDELTQLEDALSHALQGNGSAWLIGGESGVGKSRLLDELQVRAMVQGAMVLTGQGVMSGGLPYQLWRDPVRRLALVTEISDLDAAILKEIAPNLDRLLGYDVEQSPSVDKEASQKRLIAAIIALIRTYGKPIVLLLEDLQWMIESLTVVKQLAQAVVDLPVLVLATYRSDERPNLPQELDQMQFMMLDRLNSTEISDLSASMLGQTGRTPQVVDLLAKETEGNVFFLIETVRALAEEAGTLENIGRMTLPPTVFAGGVQRAVDRRLRAVPEHFQPLLQIAAVAGRFIDHHVMSQLSDDTNFEAWLDACINSAVFTVQDGQYHFSHDKIREGILNRIDDATLTDMSHQVATAIETAYPNDDSFALVLAQHWQNAHNPEKECHYSYLVGKQVRHRNIHQARESALRVLALIGDDIDDPRLAEIQWMLGILHLNMGDYNLSQTYFEAGLDTAKHQSNLMYQAQCLEGLGHIANRHNQADEAMAYYQEALTHANASQRAMTIALVMNSISGIHMERGEYDQARQLAHDSLVLARRSDHKIGIARDLNTLGIIDYYQGDLQAAWHQFEEVLAIRRELGMRHGVASIMNNIGIIASSMGKFEESIRYHEDSRKIKAEIGDRFAVGNSLQNIAVAYLHSADYAKAKTYSEEALAISISMNHHAGEADIRNNLGLILRRLGDDLDSARDHLESAIVIAGEIEDRLCVALALSNLGDVLIALEQYDVAQGILELSLKEANDLSAPQPLLRAIMWLGKLIEIEGDLSHATSLWHVVNTHPHCDTLTQQDSQVLLASSKEKLSPDAFSQAIEASHLLELDDIIALFLSNADSA